MLYFLLLWQLVSLYTIHFVYCNVDARGLGRGRGRGLWRHSGSLRHYDDGSGWRRHLECMTEIGTEQNFGRASRREMRWQSSINVLLNLLKRNLAYVIYKNLAMKERK
jgi:hypothetical protein